MPTKIPRRYAPSSLNKRDRKKQLKAIKTSRREYKKGIYKTRPKLKSFVSKTSPHITKAKKIYKVKRITANKTLSKKTGCSVKALKKIVNKGVGAYFSTGSRPNQTGLSWGRARLASAITGGPSSRLDYSILKKGCKKNSKALKKARKPKKKLKKK